jgi:tetratricopeptide (TPR) repeat protein
MMAMMIQKAKMKLSLKSNIVNKLAVIFVTAFFLLSCDFTPRLHKKIIDAQQYIKLQRYSDAIAQYELILKSSPPNDIKVKIYYQLGELYSINLSKNIKAINYFKKIKTITNEPLWLVKVEERIGEINFNFTKDYDESIKSYKMLTAFTPKLENLDFYQNRLALSYRKGNYLSKAKEEFLKIQSDQNHKFFIKSFYYLGLIHFQERSWNKAIYLWNEYIKREPRKDSIVQTKFLMANAYETMEELKKAYNIYYSILGEYPNTDVIQNRLNAIYKRRIARKR